MNKKYDPYNQNSFYNGNVNGLQNTQTHQFGYPQQNTQAFYPQAPQPVRPQPQQINFRQQLPVAYPVSYQDQNQTSTQAFFSRHNYVPAQNLSQTQQFYNVPVREKTKLEEKLDALEKMFNDRLINAEEYYERRKK